MERNSKPNNREGEKGERLRTLNNLTQPIPREDPLSLSPGPPDSGGPGPSRTDAAENPDVFLTEGGILQTYTDLLHSVLRFCGVLRGALSRPTCHSPRPALLSFADPPSSEAGSQPYAGHRLPEKSQPLQQTEAAQRGHPEAPWSGAAGRGLGGCACFRGVGRPAPPTAPPFLQSGWCGEPPREPPGEDEDDEAETGAPCGGKGWQAALGTLKPALSPGDEDEEEAEDTEEEPLSLRASPPAEPLE
ncbi:hypothetical protein H920_01537 [Fukomys damarensis]|uniref:Uncharacterized protein n=1 Tax=Fukomys damarensis TaxID=885580 RepID=A0A091EN45_FUKDA|nr:hypothetical protein H920_01537 [Fukomys damarensis]